MSERVKALLVMVVGIAAVIAYAVVPQEIDNGYIRLRKLSLGRIGNAVPWLSASVAAGDSLKAQRKTASAVDSTRQTVLFFGDSMTDGLAQWLGGYCQPAGHKIYSIVWYSATTERYAKSNVLETYIKLYHPTFFIVCLGSNELFVRDLADREKYIQAIIKKFGNRPFVWISPPNWKHDTGIDSLICKYTGTNRYFDSSAMKLTRSRDGMHPTNSASKLWADSIAAWLRNPRRTAHPILLGTHNDVPASASYDIYLPEFDGFENGDTPERHRHFER